MAVSSKTQLLLVSLVKLALRTTIKFQGFVCVNTERKYNLKNSWSNNNFNFFNQYRSNINALIVKLYYMKEIITTNHFLLLLNLCHGLDDEHP